MGHPLTKPRNDLDRTQGPVDEVSISAAASAFTDLQRADCDLFITFCTARISLPEAARDLLLEHCLREGVARTGAGARATNSKKRKRPTMFP